MGLRATIADGGVVHDALCGERLPPRIFLGVTMCGLVGTMVRVGRRARGMRRCKKCEERR